MNRLRFPLLPALTWAALSALAMQCSPAFCQIIRITNSSNIIQTLSDLVVRDGSGHVKTVLKPGESSGDDRNIESGEYTDVDTGFGFEVKSVEVSRADEIGGKYVESLTYVLKATDLHQREIEFLTSVPSNDALAVDLDADVNFPTFPAGTILNFVNGTNPNVPGWFVGTGFDPNTGVTGSYTGPAQVTTALFRIDIVPEPPVLGILGAGIAALLAQRRLRRGNR